MQRLGLAILGLLIAGCPVPLATGADAGTSPLVEGDGGLVAASATGSGCTVQTAAGTPLCEAISVCPSVVVDPSVYPTCGFRIRGAAIDLECECNGYLCPIGTATDCSDAASLLAQQNSNVVCSHASEGSCILETGTASPTDGGTITTTSGPSSSCDTTCEATCVNDPNCIQACGC
jgi:hypothetical protein